MKKRTVISTVVAGILLCSSALYANNNFEAQKNDIKRLKNVVNKEAESAKESLKKSPKEVVEGMKQTIVAIKALQNKDAKTAKEALQKASKLFDTAIKDDPKLALVPVANSIEVHDFTGDSKLVKETIKTAQDLLDDYETQAARALLMPLKDDMIITTQYLPMGIYPLATKDALKQLNEGKEKEAFSTLVTALHEVVVQFVVIPLPLITAQSLVIEASQLDKKEKTKALKLLDAAQDELEKAVLLGYTKKHAPEYATLKKEIKNIQKEIKGKNIVEKLYEKIKKDFASLLSKHESESTTKKQDAK